MDSSSGSARVTLGKPEVYNIGQPYSNGRAIVYGDCEMCWYEYVLVDSQGLVEFRSDCDYGSAEIALRDALIRSSGGAQ